MRYEDMIRVHITFYLSLYQMQQDNPVKDFTANVLNFELKINLIAHQTSDVSHYEDTIAIYASNMLEKYCFEDLFNINNISAEAKAIFFDIPTIFDYIVENCNDSERFQISEKGIMICNLVKVKNAVKRQEVFLPMQKKVYVLPEKPLEIQIQLNQQISFLKSKSQHFQKQIKGLQSSSLTFIQKLESILLQNKEQTSVLRTQIEAEAQKFMKEQEQTKKTIKNLITQQKYMIDCINELRRQLGHQREQKQQFKEQLRQIRKMIKSPNNANYSQIGNRSLLGQKIDITIDQENQYLIQKRNGDQTRFQILGTEILGNTGKHYFEVKAINLVNNGLIIGVVSQARKGQRHSYDQKECICYDGTGKIFELGRKWPAPVKLQSGHTVKVVVDFDQMLIKWFISFTEIGSVLIPDTLRDCKLVPYIQLNQVKDKISLNS